MKSSGVTVAHDSAMLVVICTLQVWRFTGVPLHEVVALLLAAGVAAHLIMQWQWIAAQSRRLFSRQALRTRVSYALNASLFASMTTVTVTGLMISKFVMPRTDQPSGEWLKWHHIHDTSSRVLLLLVGLHLALNWGLLRDALRRVLAGRRKTSEAARERVVAPVASARGSVVGRLAARAAAVGLAVACVSAVVYAIERALPPEQLYMMHADGSVEPVDAPPDLARIHPDQERPDPLHSAAPLAVQFAAVGVIALVGRKVLRIRL